MSGLDPNVGRRVLQCECGRVCEWKGRETAVAAGWGAKWVAEVCVWSCPDCYVPPPPVPVVPRSLDMPETLRSFANARAPGARAQAQRNLHRLLEVDPELGRAWSKEVLMTTTVGKGECAKEWKRWAAEHRAQLKEPRMRPPRPSARGDRRRAA